MKLCILDADTLGPDMGIAPLEALGELAVYGQTRPEEVRERLRDVQVAIVNKVVLTAQEMAAAPGLA